MSLGLFFLGTACQTISIVDVRAEFVFQLEARNEAGDPVRPYSLEFADIGLTEHQKDEAGWAVIPVAVIEATGPVRRVFSYSWSETWAEKEAVPKADPTGDILVIVDAEGYQRWTSRVSILQLPRDPANRIVIDLGKIRLLEELR